MFKIPNYIENIIKLLKINGYDAYIVGGCVRDMLCGIIPHDYDITTSAKPNDIQKIFSNTLPTGIKHGTVTVISNDIPVEVTTFRSDGNYTDSRRPDYVNFVKNLKEDLKRRDFTINAMAYNNEAGLCDFFGGQKDLKNKILKTVGDPSKRFNEDALRIMRLFRFSAVLDFTIESKTLDCALNNSFLLSKVSSERIYCELIKIICSDNPEKISPLIISGGLKHLGIKEFNKPSLLKLIKSNDNIRLFTFLRLCNCDIESVLQNLKVSNQQKNYCKSMNLLLHYPYPQLKTEIKEFLYLTSTQTVYDYFEYNSTVLKANTKLQYQLLNDILINKEPYRIKDLKINGNDLKAIGIGDFQIGNVLELLRKYTVSNPTYNDYNKLIKKAHQINVTKN